MTTSETRRWSEEPTHAVGDGAPLVSGLVGRDDELKLIESLLGGSGSCLLLSGGPGVGKTALLDAAAVRGAAAGMRVLRASGVEFEAEIAFSALHQLIYPLREDVERIAEQQRDALRRVLNLAHVGQVGPTDSATAVLALLAEAAGNPLAVLELPTALTGRQRSGRDPSWKPPTTYQHRFASTVSSEPGGPEPVDP